jgi:5-methyltetrahydrofolate--homocysteine methyltransferase
MKIIPDRANKDIIEDILLAFQKGLFDRIASLIENGLDAGIEPSNLIENGLVKGIRQVGEQFQRGEVYLPEMMMAAEIWQECMSHLSPLLADAQITITSVGRVVAGTVQGDIHNLGKDIVITMLRAVNFEVIDLGVDVKASKFVDEAVKNSAHIIAASALMTTTMPYQRQIIEHLEAAGKRNDFYVMVGGGPTNANWAEEIQADGYGKTAADAVALAFEYMSKITNGSIL